MLDNRKVIIDDECKIADTGSAVITTSAAATVDGVAKVFDTGGGYTEGKFVVDAATITASGVAASCQQININLEGSTTSTFTNWVRLAKLALGPKATVHGRSGNDASAASLGAGRYILPFTNDFAGTVYRWLRVYTTFNGTVATIGAKFKAYLSK